MRSKPPHSILSVVLGEQELYCAQLTGGSASPKVIRTWAFELTEGLSLDAPDALGLAFAEHLKAAGVPSLPVVLGLSARWMLLRPAQFPAVPEEDLPGVVGLQIETDFAQSAQELVFDYQPFSGPDGRHQVQIVAAPSPRVAQAKQFALAAKLRLAGITTPVLEMPIPQTPGVVVVSASPSASLVTHQRGRVTGLSTCENEPSVIARSLAMQSAGDAVQGVTLYAFEGQDVAELEALLTKKLGRCTLEAYHPAKAMGTGWLSHPDEAINLAQSRLEPAPPRKMTAPLKWGVRATAAVVLLALGLGYLWLSANSRLSDLEDEYALIHDDAKAVHAMKRDTRSASGWYDNRPPILDCLLELTRTFPIRGRIWVTKLSMDDRMHGTLECKAEDRDTMLAYVESMKGSTHLTDVQLHDSNVTGREETLVTFEITFTYVDQPEEARS